MADGVEITTTGFAEVERSLDDLGQSLGEQICRKALRAGGNVMKAALAASAPVRPDLPSGTALPPGAMQSDIQLTVSKDRGQPDSFSAWIEPGPATIAAARWTEWGHVLVKGKKVIGDVVAHPWIRPAFDANEDLAFQAVAEAIATEVNKVASERGLNAGR